MVRAGIGPSSQRSTPKGAHHIARCAVQGAMELQKVLADQPQHDNDDRQPEGQDRGRQRLRCLARKRTERDVKRQQYAREHRRLADQTEGITRQAEEGVEDQTEQAGDGPVGRPVRTWVVLDQHVGPIARRRRQMHRVEHAPWTWAQAAYQLPVYDFEGAEQIGQLGSREPSQPGLQQSRRRRAHPRVVACATQPIDQIGTLIELLHQSRQVFRFELQIAVEEDEVAPARFDASGGYRGGGAGVFHQVDDDADRGVGFVDLQKGR